MNETKTKEENLQNSQTTQDERGVIKIKRDTLRRVLIILVKFIILLLVFGTGMFIGAAKVKFSYRWAENYHRNFGGPGGGFMRDWRLPPPVNEFIDGHGTFGDVIKIDNSELVIKGKDNIEKLVLIKDNTTITIGRQKAKKEDIKIGDSVMIIGSPNDAGQIEAKLIRIFKGREAEGFFNFPQRPFI